MIVRSLDEVKVVNWGNGLSRRFLNESDGMGFTLTDTVIWAGTSSKIKFSRHIEACYCIEGGGYVVFGEGRKERLTVGAMYAPNLYDPHELIADEEQDMRLVCVLVPALQGDETHNLESGGYSGY